MKNIFKTILSLAIASVIAWSCERVNHDYIVVTGDGDSDLSGRQYANIDPPTNLPFLFNQTTSITIDLGKYEDTGTTITNVEITKTLTRGGVSSAPVTYIVNRYRNYSQSLTELLCRFPIGGDVMNTGFIIS